MPAVSSLPPAPTIRVGSILDDRYVLVRLIGAGATGTVFEAQQRDRGKHVAVKVLHDARGPEALDRFLGDARAAARIAHPRVVDVLDVGITEQGRGYVVMELLNGVNLEELLARAPLRSSDACDYALQILQAVAAAHALGVVHRDLRPANVHVDRRTGAVKVLDFGLADVEGNFAADVASAAARYRAPELLRGMAADERADVYSTAALLHEMLVGLPAPSRSSTLDTFSPRDANPALLHDLADVVARGMAYEREKRFDSPWEFAQALAPFASASGRELLLTFPGREHSSAPQASLVQWGGVGAFVSSPRPDLESPAIPRHPAPPRFDGLSPPLGLPALRQSGAPLPAVQAASKPRMPDWGARAGMLAGAVVGSAAGALIAWWAGLL